MDSDATEHSRLLIRCFGAQYLVAAEHPAPERVKARLDEAITHDLAQALSAGLVPLMPDNDPSIWLIRRLEVEVDVNMTWEREQLARAWAQQIVCQQATARREAGSDGNVLWFPHRAAFLARFLVDVAAGHAWGKWYYASFEGLRRLPVSAALRTVLCENPELGRTALLTLSPDDLQQTLRALTAQDARRVLETIAADAPAGDEWHCLQAAWSAWQTMAWESFSAVDEWRAALQCYLHVSRDEVNASGLPLRAATLALLSLARHLRQSTTAQRQAILAALSKGELAMLYSVAGVADAEMLLPLLHYPPQWVQEVGQTMCAQWAGQTTDAAEVMPGLRYTPFGGTFLLLPLLDALPLVEATHGWPDTDAAAAISLVRFLLLAKCCGRERAHRAFTDPLLRDLLLVPPTLSPASIADWQARISPAHLHTFLATLAAWHGERGAVAGETLLLARCATRGEPVAVLSDSARGIWLHAAGYPRHTERLIAMLRDWLARSAQEPPVLLCDQAFTPALRAALPALQIISMDDAAVNAIAEADHRLAELIARLDRLTGDFVYLSLPHSCGVARGLDRALSVAAQGLLRNFAWRLPGFAGSHLPYLFDNFLAFSGSVEEEPRRRVVRLGRPPLHLVLNMTGMARHTYQLSWLDERPLALFQEG